MSRALRASVVWIWISCKCKQISCASVCVKKRISYNIDTKKQLSPVPLLLLLAGTHTGDPGRAGGTSSAPGNRPSCRLTCSECSWDRGGLILKAAIVHHDSPPSLYAGLEAVQAAKAAVLPV